MRRGDRAKLAHLVVKHERAEGRRRASSHGCWAAEVVYLAAGIYRPGGRYRAPTSAATSSM